MEGGGDLPGASNAYCALDCHETVSAAYAYDSRGRCSGIDQHNGSAWVDLVDYTWLGNALSKRETTCDYPGGTHPKFRADFQRDGLLRVVKVENKHLTEDMATSGYADRGTSDYGYDTASNVLSALQSATMDELDADRDFTYDSLNRLIILDTPPRPQPGSLRDGSCLAGRGEPRTDGYPGPDGSGELSHPD